MYGIRLLFEVLEVDVELWEGCWSDRTWVVFCSDLMVVGCCVGRKKFPDFGSVAVKRLKPEEGVGGGFGS